MRYADIAQLVEHTLGRGEVIGSIPIVGSMFYVYFLYSAKLKKYYTGYTDDVNRRLLQHNSEKIHYTRTGTPWSLVGYETYKTKEEAFSREQWIKRMKSNKILKKIFDSHGWV